MKDEDELCDCVDFEHGVGGSSECDKCYGSGYIDKRGSKMKAYAILITGTDGRKEGVIFTDKDDAMDALNGCESGSALAVNFTDSHGDYTKDMVEVEID